METPQDELVKNIVLSIADDGIIDEDVKIKLAQIVREHYIKHPKALDLQAKGNSIPTTVQNHKQ